MKFLVDNQLPPALARFISADLGATALHVRDVGMERADDAVIWRYAIESDATVISKDEDFVGLLFREPSGSLIRVCLANCRRQRLLDVFRIVWSDIVVRLANGDRLIEIR